MELPTRVRAIYRNGRTVVAVLIKNADVRAEATSGVGYVSRLKFESDGICVAEAFAGAQAARNPLIRFEIENIEPGTMLAVSWKDNHGNHGSARAPV